MGQMENTEPLNESNGESPVEGDHPLKPVYDVLEDISKPTRELVVVDMDGDGNFVYA